MDLHAEIMNISIDEQSLFYTHGNEGLYAYKLGHRDARHAAAEIALKAQARIEELELAAKVNAEDCNEAERILRNIVREWSCSGDVFGAIMQAKEFLK